MHLLYKRMLLHRIQQHMMGCNQAPTLRQRYPALGPGLPLGGATYDRGPQGFFHSDIVKFARYIQLQRQTYSIYTKVCIKNV